MQERIIHSDWFGCYRKQWQGILTPDSFCHPAKVSLGLIERIYEHAFELGWISKGSIVIDPFGGIAGCAWPGLWRGVHFIGVELEEKFVRLGNVNISVWNRRYGHKDGWGTARLIQGDSRKLTQVLSEASACLSSPPYAGSQQVDNRTTPVLINNSSWKKRQGTITDGEHPANLGNLREGSHADAVQAAISSPPYAESLKPETEEQTTRKQARIARSKTLYDGRKVETPSPGKAGLGGGYGTTEGNLGAMPTGDICAAIASPPYAEGCQQQGNDLHPDRMQGSAHHPARYDLSVSSPPYAESLASDDPDRRGGLFNDPKRRRDKTLTAEYGSSEGQLGAMRTGEFGAAVSSPPFESTVNRQGEWTKSLDPQKNKYPQNRSVKYIQDQSELYGQHPAQLGNSTGDTFWSAARTILEQTYSVLAPNAHAIWVVKGFVRNKAYVDFPDQWRQLCEAVGFRTLHLHRCWLIERGPSQHRLDGGEDDLSVERKSFFRRLAERKGSPRVDYEVVLCMQKQ